LTKKKKSCVSLLEGKRNDLETQWEESLGGFYNFSGKGIGAYDEGGRREKVKIPLVKTERIGWVYLESEGGAHQNNSPMKCDFLWQTSKRRRRSRFVRDVIPGKKRGEVKRGGVDNL